MRSILLFTACTALLSLAACAQEDTGSGTTSADLTDAQRAAFGAQRLTTPAPPMPELPRYNVPVATGELEPWAWYAVDAAGAFVKNGTITFHYPFPKLITGEQQFVELVGDYVPGQTHVVVTAGEYGEGTCDLEAGVWSCHEQLPGLRVDAAKAKANLVAAGLNNRQIAKRLQVTAKFSVDPIGIFQMSADQVETQADDDDYAAPCEPVQGGAESEVEDD